MTLITPFSLRTKLKKIDNILTPKKISVKNISVVIPVKNNQKGIDMFLDSYLSLLKKGVDLPDEIIIVDDNSKAGLQLAKKFRQIEEKIILVKSESNGVSAARNTGWRKAKGDWVHFTDSDCVLTETTYLGYMQKANGSIAYAGNIESLGGDTISQFYYRQETLLPYKDPDDGTPFYIVTANCLVWKEGLRLVNGFNQSFIDAGGEDIDIGFRLSQYGKITFVLKSTILHDFSDGIFGFINRFYRYGKSLKKIKKIYDLRQPMIWIKINSNGFAHFCLGLLMNMIFNIGYFKERT